MKSYNSHSFSHLKFFCCLRYASTLTRNQHKFDPRAKACIFICYTYGIKGYKLFDIQSQTTFISSDVIFHENIFPNASHSLIKYSNSTSSVIPLSIPNNFRVASYCQYEHLRSMKQMVSARGFYL